MDGWKESCSISLTRSVLRVAAPEAEDEALCRDCIYHCGDDEAQQPSLLALALADHSAVELNGKNTVFTRLGAIALSADETSSAVFRGNVFVNDVNSKGDISLGGNITIDMETGDIKASALHITAPGVTVTAAEYHFNKYDPAEGVAAVPSIDVHKEEGLGGWFVVEGDVRLTGTVRFVETPAKTGIKTAEPIKDGLRCLLTAPADSLLIAASYDKNGALTGVATARIAEACEPAEHTVALRLEEGGSYRLMLVNASTFAPLCAAREGVA